MKRKDVARLVKVADMKRVAHERVEALEREDEELADRLMPSLNAYDGTKWERLEKYHLGCDICQGQAVQVARKWLGKP